MKINVYLCKCESPLEINEHIEAAPKVQDLSPQVRINFTFYDFIAEYILSMREVTFFVISLSHQFV